jgi:hypothetical protein
VTYVSGPYKTNSGGEGVPLIYEIIPSQTKRYDFVCVIFPQSIPRCIGACPKPHDIVRYEVCVCRASAKPNISNPSEPAPKVNIKRMAVACAKNHLSALTVNSSPPMAADICADGSMSYGSILTNGISFLSGTPVSSSLRLKVSGRRSNSAMRSL